MFVLSSQTAAAASGKKTEREEGLFPTKGDTTTTHGFPTKKGQNDNMPEEICLLLLKRRLSIAASGCHSKVNCRSKEQWQSV